jgi:CTP:molybdopterin cytidylyltransferase MocA
MAHRSHSAPLHRIRASMGYAGINIGNLFGLQAADPMRLASVADPIGADNDAHLAAVGADNDLVLLAWGNHPDLDRARAIARMLWQLSEHCGGSLAVLGWTERGQPRHPLHAPKDSTPECLTFGADGRGLHEAQDRDGSGCWRVNHDPTSQPNRPRFTEMPTRSVMFDPLCRQRLIPDQECRVRRERGIR